MGEVVWLGNGGSEGAVFVCHQAVEGRSLAYLRSIEAEDLEDLEDNEVSVEACVRVSPVQLGSGKTVEQGQALMNEKHTNEVVVAVIGRWWTSDPDLMYRFKNTISLTQYDRSTFHSRSLVGTLTFRSARGLKGSVAFK